MKMVGAVPGGACGKYDRARVDADLFDPRLDTPDAIEGFVPSQRVERKQERAHDVELPGRKREHAFHGQ